MKRSIYSLKSRDYSIPAALTMFAVSLSTMTIAMAQTESIGEDDSKWGLGAGVTVIQKPYRDIDADILPVPLFLFENHRISASISKVDYKFISTEHVSLSLRARYVGDGYDADKSPFLAGMKDRKGSVWAGSAMTWKTNIADLSAEVIGDVSGYSKGTRAKFRVERRFTSGKFTLTPRLEIEWVDSKFVDYYYGVKTSEVRVDRKYYGGNSSSNVEAGMRMDYALARKHIIYFDTSATRFGRAVKESPIVDNPSQTAVSVGYIYRF
jgi:outer membrane protein